MKTRNREPALSSSTKVTIVYTVYRVYIYVCVYKYIYNIKYFFNLKMFYVFMFYVYV